MQVPAKINLYLHITGKRPDGYHLLDSLIVFTDICDEVIIEKSDKFSLEISGEFVHLVESNEHNIVVRAAKLMAEECKNSANISIKLVKNIPVGAGLGGGSADAAAAIILLNQLWQANLPRTKLYEIGLKLGADVPIFINRNAAYISGIGEGISDIDTLPELYAILVYPNKPLSTKDVFSHVIPAQAGRHIKSVDPHSYSTTEYIQYLKNQKNDLEDAAIKLLPEIQDILAELSTLEGCEFAKMSGSGSTCFALFSDKKQAEKNITKLHSLYPNYWIKLCKLITSY